MIQSDLELILAVMETHHVPVVVIGGQAEALHGSTRVTLDVDLCYRREPGDLE